jgi:1-acyl-sn-glycerol-3-phosphate acyltransferase
MDTLQYHNSVYTSSGRQLSFFRKLFPSAAFYYNLFLIVYRASRLAKRGDYDGSAWAGSSYDVLQELEKIGIQIEITGIEHVLEHNRPAVIIGNHMSMMETLLLPVMIQPLMDVTFVVKESLLHYPVFKHVMRSRNPVAVGRTNPREDLKVVMSQGVERLDNGISVIVFPQTTRAQMFDPKQMSSIGVKLAKKADVSVIPLALKTDAWRNGKMLKDFGRIDRKITVHFAFGKPLKVGGRGSEEHQIINDFITEKLSDWRGG